jgi:2-polyprenyl-3-methyl-5-hydroxy-6-metoxy-1,4-benzoquinol methylase
MQPEISMKLIALNHQFYQTFAEDFSETRQRLQPGVVQVLDAVPLSSTVLDLGCGNGQLAAYLHERGFSGSYLGIDSAQKLVEIGQSLDLPNANFIQGDFSSPDWDSSLNGREFEYVVCFAVMHHLPSNELRVTFLKKVKQLLAPGGSFIHSNWQFLESEKLRSRVLSWETIGLTEANVDPHDYLLDWRRGGSGIRYVHYFTNPELHALAEETGFKVVGLFTSDGDGNNLGLYQIWEPVS